VAWRVSDNDRAVSAARRYRVASLAGGRATHALRPASLYHVIHNTVGCAPCERCDSFSPAGPAADDGGARRSAAA